MPRTAKSASLDLTPKETGLAAVPAVTHNVERAATYFDKPIADLLEMHKAYLASDDDSDPTSCFFTYPKGTKNEQVIVAAVPATIRRAATWVLSQAHETDNFTLRISEELDQREKTVKFTVWFVKKITRPRKAK